MKVKYFFSLFATAILLFSCSEDDNNEANEANSVVGTWRMVARNLDPGDGSGEFTPVTSNKTITFESDGTVTSNGNLCSFSVDSDTPTSGTYSVEEGKIYPTDCDFTFGFSDDLTFELVDGEMITSVLCFEPCEVKYVRQESR